MLRNYLLVAWRNLQNNKVFSAINIFGLAVGLTCCMLITLYIYHETGYDQHHKNGDRVFQLGTIFIDQGIEDAAANTSAPLGKMLQQEFPEIEVSARMMMLWQDDKTLFQVKGESGTIRSFYETKGFLADSSFFEILTYTFAEGSAANALAAPNSVVISEQLAHKLFGTQAALNKIIRISSGTNGDHDTRITGVFKMPKTPSHIDAQFFMSFGGGDMYGFAYDNPSLSNNNMFFTYLKLKEGANATSLKQKFPLFIDRHLGAQLKGMGKQRKYSLTPVADIHLSGGGNNASPGGNKTVLFILGSIAVLTLIIACINFMNLSTASSSKRAAEVGVRKVLGAHRSSLLQLFLGESVLMALIALLFALVLTYLLLPLFGQVAGKAIHLSMGVHLMLLGGFIILALATGLLAGSYPAFYLSSFKPIGVLKGKFTNSLAAVSLRKGLVVFQFVISIGLIIASVVIARQMDYLRSKDLGFIKDQQVVVPLRTGSARENIQAFKNEVSGHASIASIGASMSYPGITHPQDWLMYRQGQNADQSKKIYINMIDDNLLQTLGVQLVAGRLFSDAFTADTLSRFVVNEETVKQFGFASPHDALGKWLAFEWDGEQLQFTIIGVVKNFHFQSLQENIQPLAFRLYNDASFNYLIAHTNGSNIDQAMAALGAAWKKLNPAEPFEYSFIDQDFQKNYEAESRQASLIRYFTIIAIIISCLGLFGLATFTAEQRTKEIGIRKVLGASVLTVVGLLSKEFLKLVLIAILIATPVAWYVMHQWLQNFAYQTDISWQVFALTTAVALLISFITVSYQAIRAALANPVKNLRTE
jgi:putative ABC transport system permease protein